MEYRYIYWNIDILMNLESTNWSSLFTLVIGAGQGEGVDGEVDDGEHENQHVDSETLLQPTI